jgi:hypothetical protein
MEVVNIVTKGEEMNKEKAGETLGCGVGCLAYIIGNRSVVLSITYRRWNLDL